MTIGFLPRKKTKKVTESDIQKKIMEWVKIQPDIRGWKASDMYTRGVTDTVLCIRGLFVAIEVKKPGETPTPLQKGFIQDINNLNGLAFYCDSFEGYKKCVEFIRIQYREVFEVIAKRRSFLVVKDERLVI